MIEDLFETIRRACAAPEWSAGVKLARAGAVIGERADDEEIELKVTTGRGPLALNVSLYPEDDDWSCDCDSRAAVCQHVAAAVIALRQAHEEGDPLPTPAREIGHVRYHLERGERGLAFRRALVLGEREAPLEASLTLAAAGRAESPPVAIGPHDLDVEDAMGRRRDGPVPRDALPALLRALASCSDVRLDGRPVRTSPQPVPPVAIVGDAGDGFEVRIEPDPCIDEVFANGAVRVGDQVRPIGEGGLGRDELRGLARRRVYTGAEIPTLVTEVLPRLERHLRLDVRTSRLPRTSSEPPRVVVETSARADRLVVEAALVYGDPVEARVVDGALHVVGGAVPARDPDEEARLVERVRRELGLVPGQPAVLDGEEAVAFASRLRAWRGDVVGTAHEGYRLAPPLTPRVEVEGGRFALGFRSEAGEADPARVLAAWQRGSALAPLEDGGWAPLPVAWLAAHGRVAADLLAARQAGGAVPRALLPDLARLCDALDLPRPAELAGLEALVDGFAGLPEAPLPGDLTATLRAYQRRGVDWLAFLRGAGLGAVLADDMGLGKTLQALAVVEGATLVVAPTSVLQNWHDEARRFRPSLRICRYHGPRRALDPEADLTITSWALLRLDADALAARRWRMVVLDEAQAIKNPDSQVSQAAFRLDADFKVTLTGTPVENRLEELWSQLHFTNPGLLGGRRQFQERVARPIAAGEAGAAARLRERIRPFVLRRMKREVAPELPPRTDVVLHAELSEAERTVYDGIRAATQREVVARLGAGGSVLEALEALLRLRQAACHRALVPGQQADTSAKVEVLMEVLDEAVAEGHKALVFSQWTSLLDLVEPHLRRAGIPFARLDGSTRDRGGVVARFQDDAGPPVMLLSLKAGGTGLNLTAADHVFLLDPWWNPAVEDQAADRAHRIGQDRPVLVHRLVAADTVEERILALQASKRALADAALGEADRAMALTRDDLLALLA